MQKYALKKFDCLNRYVVKQILCYLAYHTANQNKYANIIRALMISYGMYNTTVIRSQTSRYCDDFQSC
jgi:hypothetical protein